MGFTKPKIQLQQTPETIPAPTPVEKTDTDKKAQSDYETQRRRKQGLTSTYNINKPTLSSSYTPPQQNNITKGIAG